MNLTRNLQTESLKGSQAHCRVDPLPTSFAAQVSKVSKGYLQTGKATYVVFLPQVLRNDVINTIAHNDKRNHGLLLHFKEGKPSNGSLPSKKASCSIVEGCASSSKST